MPHVFKLKNGLTCICDERPGSGKISIDLSVRGGSSVEEAHEKGLTFLTHKSLLAGTKKKTRDEIVDFIEQRGGMISSSASRQSSGLDVTFLARYLEDVMPVFEDVLKNPALDVAEIEKTKSRILKQIEKRNQKPTARAQDKMFEALMGDVGLPATGDKTTLANMTQQDLAQRHVELLSDPENMVISFSGDITRAQAEEMAEKHFGDLKQGQRRPKKTATFQGLDIREETENNQLNILFGFQAPKGTDPERYAYTLLNEVMSGGMSAPLFQEIREKRGLVYSVYATYRGMEDLGSFHITAGTGKGNVGELISVAFDVMGHYLEDGSVTQEDLEQAVTRLVREAESRLESADFASSYYASQFLAHGRVRDADELRACLEQVTPAHLQKAVYDMFLSGEYTLSNVGPQDTMPDAKAIRDLMEKQLVGKNAPKVAPLTGMKQSAASNNAAQQTAKPKQKVTVLPNGLTVVTDERPGSVSIGAWVKAGSDHEPEHLNGATHMNEHMMFRGTPSYGSGEIDRVIEQQLGGGLNAYTSKDKTAYYFYNLLPEHLDKVVHICGDMVFDANIAEPEFDGKMEKQPDGSEKKGKGERDVVIEEIRQYADDVGSVRWNLMDELAYPNQTHGRPILGTEKTLRAMTADQLRAYRDEFYAPNTVVFSCAGPISHEDFVKAVEKRYGHLKPSQCDDLPTPVYQGGTGYVLSDDAELNAVAFVTETVPEGHDKMYAYHALGEILGGGQSSRLHKTLVNDRQLVPGVAAGQVPFYNVGQFLVFTNVETTKTEDVLEGVFETLSNVIDNLTQDELDKAKAQMEIELLESMETNMNACRMQGEEALLSGQPFDREKEAKKIQSLTVEDVKSAARQILTSNPTVAMVAPKKTDPKTLPDHKRVLNIRDKYLPTPEQNNTPTPQPPRRHG